MASTSNGTAFSGWDAYAVLGIENGLEATALVRARLLDMPNLRRSAMSTKLRSKLRLALVT